MANPQKPSELVRRFLDRHSARLDAALREALAKPIRLEPGRRLQFEICPFFYRVVLTDTEQEILPKDWFGELPGTALEQVEQEGGDPLEVFSQAVVDWLADGWQRIGGPKRYRPAFAFYHGYHGLQFDLERHCWVSAEEAFGD
jgi:hypothetical protein